MKFCTWVLYKNLLR